MSSKAETIRSALIRLLEEHRRHGILPTSHRFLFYELVSRGIIYRHSQSGPARAPGAAFTTDDVCVHGNVRINVV